MAADDSSWPGVAPPAGWFLHAQEPSPGGRMGNGPAVPDTTYEASAELERITSEPLAPELLASGGREPELPEPELHEPGVAHTGARHAPRDTPGRFPTG